MGLARGLIASPDEVIAADITVDLQLDRQVSFDLATAPPVDPAYGPVGYRTRVYTNLGGDGFIVRPDAQRSTVDATEVVVVDRLASLSRALADASYSAMVEAHTNGVYPYSKVFLPAVDLSTTVPVTQWLGIPRAVDPAPGGTPSTSRMIWDATGVTPSFNIVMIKTFPGGDAYWRAYVAGPVKQIALPDLYGLGPGLDGYPAGEMYWHVIPVLVPGMDFDAWSYRYLNDRYWTGTAGDGFRFFFPDAQ
jgi:hypothetical protein